MPRRDATIAHMDGVPPALIPAYQEIDAMVRRLEEQQVDYGDALFALARTCGGLIASAARDRADVEVAVAEFGKQMLIAIEALDRAGRLGCCRGEHNGMPDHG